MCVYDGQREGKWLEVLPNWTSSSGGRKKTRELEVKNVTVPVWTVRFRDFRYSSLEQHPSPRIGLGSSLLKVGCFSGLEMKAEGDVGSGHCTAVRSSTRMLNLRTRSEVGKAWTFVSYVFDRYQRMIWRWKVIATRIGRSCRNCERGEACFWWENRDLHEQHGKVGGHLAQLTGQAYMKSWIEKSSMVCKI